MVGLVEGVDHVPEAWVVEHDGLRCMEQRGDGACVALDPVTKLCTIYDNRPSVCREFERGGELCRKVLARSVNAQRREALPVHLTTRSQPTAEARTVVPAGD